MHLPRITIVISLTERSLKKKSQTSSPRTQELISLDFYHARGVHQWGMCVNWIASRSRQLYLRVFLVKKSKSTVIRMPLNGEVLAISKGKIEKGWKRTNTRIPGYEGKYYEQLKRSSDRRNDCECIWRREKGWRGEANGYSWERVEKRSKITIGGRERGGEGGGGFAGVFGDRKKW